MKSGIIRDPRWRLALPIEIKPIEPHQIPDAKRVIAMVAEGVFQWGKSVDELLLEFGDELKDVDEAQSHYFGRRGIFLVALDEGRVVGTGAIRPIDDKMCELKRLWLLEPYQGKGIGYAMVRRLLDFAHKNAYDRMRLQTSNQQLRAIEFYHRLGFRDVPSPDLEEGDIRMEMGLDETDGAESLTTPR
jgi:putative acetyltransferase